jgi:hypothetical protein
MAARSYNRVMAEPALAGTRLVAATLPGMAGAPSAGDMAITALARHAAEHRCDVVVGYSIGATIALEMVLSASFSGPLVLLGPIGGLGHVLGEHHRRRQCGSDGSVRPGRDACGHCRSGHWLLPRS